MGMNIFRYVQDSHESWECLSQLADVHPNMIMGTPNNKPNLESLGYTMEIVTACMNGKINKSRFNLKSYASTIVHNEMLDRKEEEKKKLRLIDRDETEECKKQRGTVYEGGLLLSTEEDKEVLEKVTKDSCYAQLDSMSRVYKRKYGVDITKLLDMAQAGYESAVRKLEEITKKDRKLSSILYEILEIS